MNINGVTELSMMKADVLSGFDTIKVCVGYEYMGQSIQYLPYDLNQNSVKPIYVELDGWPEDISKIQAKSEIPKAFKKYILFLEAELKTRISIVSVGPDRSQTLFR